MTGCPACEATIPVAYTEITQRITTMNTTFYYAPLPSELFHLQEQCTIWMPETQPLNQAIWNPSQIIATCDLSYLFQIAEMIQIGTITPSEVIWIEVKNQTATGYIFGSDGKIANFFRVV